ncbi:MAG TPA: ABC transporter permease [Isosphaeraceae bacterium]|nr:ABC transporter permease [Isosphaeraceae bacterium]
MRLTDALILPVNALWQQKLRALLSTLGVVFGAFVLAASLSIGEGVQETINRESRGRDILRRVEVFPKTNPISTSSDSVDLKVEGKMTDARRERIRKLLAEFKERSSPSPTFTGLSRERLNKLATLPHVSRLVPMVYNGGFALLGTRSEGVQMVSARPDDEACRRRIVAGRFFDSPDERAAVVSEFVAYRLGFVNDADIEGLIGKPLRLEVRAEKTGREFGVYISRLGVVTREERTALEKVTERLPAALEKVGLTKREAEVLRNALRGGTDGGTDVFTEEFTVVGVIRKPTDEELKGPWDPLRVDSDVVLPYQTALDFYFREPGRAEMGVNHAMLFVDSEENVRDVVNRVTELGVDSRAAIEFIERERLVYLLIFGGMTCVAAVALLVSGLGIANTILMSVLERTREIGIMKAVGADNRDLQFIFLVEGVLIGLVGSTLGLLLAWAASYPGDAWVRSMVMREVKIDLKRAIFVFPPWVVVTVLVFTLLVTTLAAVYPARHAARIDPVSALRHE